MTNPKEEVNRPTHPRLMSDLTEEERKSVEESIKVLPKVFRECEGYLQEYEAKDTQVFGFMVVSQKLANCSLRVSRATGVFFSGTGHEPL